MKQITSKLTTTLPCGTKVEYGDTIYIRAMFNNTTKRKNNMYSVIVNAKSDLMNQEQFDACMENNDV